MATPPRIPVWLAWDQSVVYFLTICEIRKRRAWDNAAFFSAFESAVEKLERRELWFVRSAVVMPDHLHLLATPMQRRDQPVGNLSGALKRWTKNAWMEQRNAGSKPSWDWQPGSFDRLLRQDECAQQKWEYMRANPVRTGLVDDWKQWPWTIGIRNPRESLDQKW